MYKPVEIGRTFIFAGVEYRVEKATGALCKCDKGNCAFVKNDCADLVKDDKRFACYPSLRPDKNHVVFVEGVEIIGFPGRAQTDAPSEEGSSGEIINFPTGGKQ